MKKIRRILSFLLIIGFCMPAIAAASGGERIMIFAPHPDDEALSSPGLVRKALSQGDKVKVVLFTCGDANASSKEVLVEQHPDRTFDRDGDGDFDMIDYGILRHDESMAAIKLMGLNPEDVIFMGYPDGGGSGIWSSASPQKSPHTNTDKVPLEYDFAYNPGSPYNRSSCLADFISIIREFDPTIVVTPRVTDTHGDHWALAKFVSQALSHLYTDLSNYKAHLGYLIHWEHHQPSWPGDSVEWERPVRHPKPHIQVVLADYGLTIEEKKHIIDQNFSQTLRFGRYLRNFAKRTEIFWLESLGPHGSLEEILAF
jgi:N-acetyl-1-D-myo-inositol-2-amino-2-deoxy-alpha-D-glucopyranoside deacetylase